MQDYQPNSHRYKEEQKQAEGKKVTKVVNGTVKTKKKTDVNKFKDALISDDVSNIKNFVLMDVLLPGIRNLCEDALVNAVRMLFGGSGSTNRRRSAGEHVTYSRYYDSRDRDRDRRYVESRNSRGYSQDDIIFDNRGDAEMVLTQLLELIDRYGMASISDLNELAGVTGEYTDNKYGWTSLRNAETIRVRDGYTIKLPKATILD